MKNMLCGFCIVAALGLMISEGEWFPLPNLVGAGIMLVIAALVPRASVTRTYRTDRTNKLRWMEGRR